MKPRSSGSLRVAGPPRRVAVLGGGMAALATAFALTEPSQRKRFDVTIYQMGFRLGGKCASSRRSDGAHSRIEEHGLHVLLGCYEAAFTMLRATYTELARPEGAPLATWTEAFTPQSFFTMGESIDGKWNDWRVYFPTNKRVPGDGGLWLSARDYAGMIPQIVAAIVGSATVSRSRARALAALSSRLGEVALALSSAIRQRSITPLQKTLARDAIPLSDDLLRDDVARRAWIAVDLALAIARGMLTDRLFTRGLAAIDALEFRVWLGSNGASKVTVDSPIVRGVYDLALAYRGGDAARPEIAAGVALRSLLRLALGAKGAVFYRMQAGMGESVIAPLYEVLRRRGVRFRFFHRVDRLVPAANGRSVESVEMTLQARTLGGEYHPLIEIDGLPCWPHEPIQAQLETPVTRSASSFEDNEGPSGEPITITHGDDYDIVVSALPIAVLSRVAGDLAALHPPMSRMLENVATTATQAFQIWLTADESTLGRKHPPTILGGYEQPFNTWADGSHLIHRERWVDARPGTCAYFCGPLDDAEIERARHRGEPVEASVKRSAVHWLDHHLPHLYPAAVTASGRFDFENLFDPLDRRAEERFDAQYWRANVDPSERYVLSLPGTTEHRIRGDETGFGNLLLAGDGVRTGIDVGCVEAAVVSGLQVSRALSGRPRLIPGEKDFQ